MSKETNRADKLKLIFAAYPNAKSFFVTSDDQAFTLENDANNHAKTLEDKNVNIEARPKVIKADPAEDKKADGTAVVKILTAEQQKEKDDKAALEASQKAEKDALVKEYTELFGSAPAKNIGMDALKKKIADKKTESAK